MRGGSVALLAAFAAISCLYSSVEGQTYPLCPADTVLKFENQTGNGSFVYSYGTAGNATICSGCPAEGLETRWNITANECQTIVNVNATYPLCPADTTLNFLTFTGVNYIYSYDSPPIICTGCPAEGVLTKWNPSLNQCVSIASGTLNPTSTADRTSTARTGGAAMSPGIIRSIGPSSTSQASRTQTASPTGDSKGVDNPPSSGLGTAGIIAVVVVALLGGALLLVGIALLRRAARAKAAARPKDGSGYGRKSPPFTELDLVEKKKKGNGQGASMPRYPADAALPGANTFAKLPTLPRPNGVAAVAQPMVPVVQLSEPHWFFTKIATSLGVYGASTVPYSGPVLQVAEPYAPTLNGDELRLEPGHHIELKHLFSDGWGFGICQETGEYGSLPIVCLRLPGVSSDQLSAPVPTRTSSVVLSASSGRGFAPEAMASFGSSKGSLLSKPFSWNGAGSATVGKNLGPSAALSTGTSYSWGGPPSTEVVGKHLASMVSQTSDFSFGGPASDTVGRSTGTGQLNVAQSSTSTLPNIPSPLAIGSRSARVAPSSVTSSTASSASSPISTAPSTAGTTLAPSSPLPGRSTRFSLNPVNKMWPGGLVASSPSDRTTVDQAGA